MGRKESNQTDQAQNLLGSDSDPLSHLAYRKLPHVAPGEMSLRQLNLLVSKRMKL